MLIAHIRKARAKLLNFRASEVETRQGTYIEC